MRPIPLKHSEWEQRGLPLDDAAMQQRIRSLAVSLNPDGEKALTFRSLLSVRAPLKAARSLSLNALSLSASLEWLLDNGRLVEAFVRSLCCPNAKKLPASGNTPRVQRIMKELVVSGEARITESRLIDCLISFDEVRALKMEEIWAAPAALACALEDAYFHVASRAVASQRDRLSALKWLEEGAAISPELSQRSSAFFECALELMNERELSDKRRQLAAWLQNHDMDADRLAALEHERQARDRLFLGNLLDSLRMLNTIDFSKSFAKISRTEQTLLSDPAGTYPQMDDDSCAQIRCRTAYLAERAEIGENTLARCALEAATENDGVLHEICWWLYTDEGNRLLLQRLGVSGRIRPLLPDPNGKKYICGVLFGALFLFALVCLTLGSLPALIAFPILAGVSSAALHALLPHIRRPNTLLKLKLDHIPDEYRTLLVIPALLSGPERARELARQLETLGCLETDRNLSFLLLGDLPDHDAPQREDDEEIILAANETISEMNARAGWEKYHFLHRTRTLQRCEGRYMGRERKRGALNALNRLLLTGENDFVQSSACAMAHRFTFVITLDAGTRMLPDTAKRLIGAMAHPLNRPHRLPDGRKGGYSILAPRMELPADAVTNRFIELFGGSGGVDSYPTAVSDLYQDACGQGVFGGKGIYDVASFEEALRGKLPDNAILSHDMIEGLLARSAFLSDIALYDGHPRAFRSYLMRLNRWTRGDWQLIPLLFARRLTLSALDRYKIVDNLVRSLVPPAQLILLLVGFYSRSVGIVFLGVLPLILPLLLNPKAAGTECQRILIRLSLLPHEAWTLSVAIIRAIVRMSATHRGLLQWVTSDDADRQSDGLSPFPGWAAAALLLPAVISPGIWPLPAALLAALWWTGRTLTADLEQPFEKPDPVHGEDRALLTDLAERTWRFFAENVNERGLPPDNVQLEPANGAARRTSPTNIGLYLAACTAARELGVISYEEMAARASVVVDTLEQMEKWNGQLYNWYHIDTLEPLYPRYVSSVDCGNLAGCLMMCARSLAREGSVRLAERMERLTRGMDFSSLFDTKRELFVIGMDVENNRLSRSHYDLLASESRILSFTAMMLRQIPVRHWTRLGRALVSVDKRQALTSWSGTMFEYLMPDLFMPTFRNTLLEQTQKTVVHVQKSHAVRADRADMPWGVSESGYYAFDLYLNYQYRAFGLPALSLRGDPADHVIAPYASMLALPFAPDEVVSNLKRMIDCGLIGETGLYEAADCSPERLPENVSMRIVFSHMAHHQGMILCALCNYLTDGSLTRLYMDRPEAQSLILLLQEKAVARVRLPEREEDDRDLLVAPIPSRDVRSASPDTQLPDTHLLTGLNTMAALAADGSGFLRTDGILLNRRESDPCMPPQGLFLHLRDLTHENSLLLTGMKRPPENTRVRVQFDAGSALWHTMNEHIDAQTRALVSPEDGAFLQQLTLTNPASEPIDADVTSCFQIALASDADYAAHPVFQNLFVESSRPAPNALCFRRHPRASMQRTPLLIHAVAGAEEGGISVETDLMELIGRARRISEAGALPDSLSGTLGNVLAPCSALRTRVHLPPHSRKVLCFCIGLSDEDDASSFINRHSVLQTFDRAQELSMTQAREQLRYLSLTPLMHHSLQRAAALLLYPRVHAAISAAPPEYALRKSDLWAWGVSGDLPILLGIAARADQLEPIRELIRAHEFYRLMGVKCDLILVNDYGNDYDQPVRDRLNQLIAGSHLAGLSRERGGVYLLEGQSLTERQRILLTNAAALTVRSNGGALTAQLRAAMEGIVPREAHPERLLPDVRHVLPLNLLQDNGYGGFTDEGYAVYRTPTPMPWCNLLANSLFGCMVSERGGGFLWYQNSRNGRITPFDNDPIREGWGDLIVLNAPDGVQTIPVMQSKLTTHQPGCTRFDGTADGFEWSLTHFVDKEWPIKCQRLTLVGKKGGTYRLRFYMDWLLGVMRDDRQLTSTGFIDNVFWARGSVDATAFACVSEIKTQLSHGVLTADFSLSANETTNIDVLIGVERDLNAVRSLLVHWRESGGGGARLQQTLDFWRERLNRIRLHTPDELLNRLVNSFLPYQTLCGRIWGRSGFYQSGGAYGFRDQLQDMLCILLSDPDMVRGHLLTCAAHQFESGDVMHWWHPEKNGVRTRISDDMLFLPYVTTYYVEETGDQAVLDEIVPFLRDEEIPAGRDDWYGEASFSEANASLHEHCLRAIRRALVVGEHGLLLMGSGDWNDGMNRVGDKGKGESVWLTEFMIVVLERYARFCDEETREAFMKTAGELREAVEIHGWDGRWYRRAYTDEGLPLGSNETENGCQIDSIAQSWAVMAGLSRERVKTALTEVNDRLIDRETGVIRLLTPPFDGGDADPGYIKGYPPGIRENGGQYTHAACWVVMALAELGEADRAWEAFRMLLPSNHSNTPEAAEQYRVEPYVVAADIYGEAPHAGRGGWTWYTGAAGWMVRVAYVHLMGYRRQKNRVSLHALLPSEWEEASVCIRFGNARYTLIARRDCLAPTLDGNPIDASGIEMTDDGKEHIALFPPRLDGTPRVISL